MAQVYRIRFSIKATKEFVELVETNSQMESRLDKLFESVIATPFSGIGKPEPLKGNRKGEWSRRVTDKHRMIYTVEDDIVFVISLMGHYDDK
jgi:toxin YoeB